MEEGNYTDIFTVKGPGGSTIYLWRLLESFYTLVQETWHVTQKVSNKLGHWQISKFVFLSVFIKFSINPKLAFPPLLGTEAFKFGLTVNDKSMN